MSTEQSRSTSAAGPSGLTASFSARPSSQTGSSTSDGPSANALHNHAHNQRQFIESLALAIGKVMRQMPLLGTKGAPVFRGSDNTKFIEACESLSSRKGTYPAAEEVITTFAYWSSKPIQETFKTMNGYVIKDCVQVIQEPKDAFRR